MTDKSADGKDITMNKTFYWKSPLGWIKVFIQGGFITELCFTTQVRGTISKTKNDVLAQKIISQLNEYFEGRRLVFSLPCKFQGTDFQRLVWREVGQIKYGQTSSYAEVAKRIGRPGADRAVGGGVSKNKIALIVPCHRIIRSNGELGGYAWGKKLKLDLLKHEGAAGSDFMAG